MLLRFRRRPTVICESCELTGGPFEPAEAAHLRALHDSLHHGALPPQAGRAAGPFA